MPHKNVLLFSLAYLDFPTCHFSLFLTSSISLILFSHPNLLVAGCIPLVGHFLALFPCRLCPFHSGSEATCQHNPQNHHLRGHPGYECVTCCFLATITITIIITNDIKDANMLGSTFTTNTKGRFHEIKLCPNEGGGFFGTFS